MDKKQYNSLAQIAQEIANRYGAKNMGHTDIMNNREVWFYRKPHRDNTTRTILTYDEIKEHFGFDVEEDHRRKEATRNSNVESVSSSNSEQNSAEKAEDEEMAEENIFEKLNKLFEELTRRYGRGIFGKQIEELKEKVDKLSKNPNETSIETAEFIYDDLKDLVSENYLSNLTKEKLAEKKQKEKNL